MSLGGADGLLNLGGDAGRGWRVRALLDGPGVNFLVPPAAASRQWGMSPSSTDNSVTNTE